MNRRQFFKKSGVALPAFLFWPQSRPRVSGGVQVGDPLRDRAVIWSRADRESRMVVEYATTDTFRNVRRFMGPVVTAETDFTGRVDLRNLPSGQRISFRVLFEDAGGRGRSEPVQGSFRTAPADRRDVRLVWGADTVGQGFGINPDWGGMRIYETMRQLEPDLFVHCGDTIYADGPLQAEIELPHGSRWRNIVTEAKSKVAETIDEFRGNYRYNLLDENVRMFNAEVPQIWQWDDHEVINNWSPGTELPAPYTVNIATLAARGRQAFLEYAPMRFERNAPRIYRRIPYGPLLDVFVLDLRSYRAANSYNRQETTDPETAFLGADQVAWFERELKSSRAVWKIIASDMPIGLIVADGRDAENRPRFENAANGNGPAAGRELEIARILRFIKSNHITNTMWLTGDVHYTAAHYYDPHKAQFTDFDPFWEFVSGPLNAGALPPSQKDDTFGIQAVFEQGSPSGLAAPTTGLQFFGEVFIEGRTGTATVNLRNLIGTVLFSKSLNPLRA